MSKNKTNSENEMPGAQMPMENMDGGQMPSGDGEMPQGMMMDDVSESMNEQMPPEFNEMPIGDMMADTPQNFSGQKTTTGEMPQGNMTDNSSTAFYNAKNISGDGEMPVGDMNNEISLFAADKEKLKTIEIPGNWKLQLKYSS